MTNQELLDEIVTDYVGAARSDYIGLWQIIIRVRHDFHLSDPDKIRERVMQIIEGLLSSGLIAVTLQSAEPKCVLWPNQSPDYVLERISWEWSNLHPDPDPGDIVWFALSPLDG